MRILLVIALVLVLAACGGGDSPTATAPLVGSPTAAAGATATQASATVAPGVTPGGSAVAMPGPVRLAIETAARDEGVAVEEVELVGWSQEDFESSALGCPQPDMLYLPVITPGYVVHLVVDGRELEYHTNLDTTVVRCSPPNP